MLCVGVEVKKTTHSSHTHTYTRMHAGSCNNGEPIWSVFTNFFRASFKGIYPESKPHVPAYTEDLSLTPGRLVQFSNKLRRIKIIRHSSNAAQKASAPVKCTKHYWKRVSNEMCLRYRLTTTTHRICGFGLQQCELVVLCTPTKTSSMEMDPTIDHHSSFSLQNQRCRYRLLC